MNIIVRLRGPDTMIGEVIAHGVTLADYLALKYRGRDGGSDPLLRLWRGNFVTGDQVKLP
jgi:hypothetical protein